MDYSFKQPDEAYPRIEPNARELYVIEYIAALDYQLMKGDACLEERLKLVPDAWRQYRMSCNDGKCDAVFAKIKELRARGAGRKRKAKVTPSAEKKGVAHAE